MQHAYEVVGAALLLLNSDKEKRLVALMIRTFLEVDVYLEEKLKVVDEVISWRECLQAHAHEVPTLRKTIGSTRSDQMK